MIRPMSNLLADLRAASRLAVDATQALTDVVEAMHQAASPVERRARAPRTSGLTGLVYGSVRGITRLTGAGLDRLLAGAAPLVPSRTRSPTEEAVIAALNGVVGDRLHDGGNGLAIPMRLRQGGRPLVLEPQALREALPKVTPRIVVLVHGLCMNDLQWRRGGPSLADRLSGETGFTPVHLHYNTGRHVASNGVALAALLESLVAAWPVAVDELAIVGHSMGGLVARSAHHAASQRGMAWADRLGRMVFLGTPHHGAPLERGGHVVDGLLGALRHTSPLARVGQLRSAGITDLRHGSVLEADWRGHDRFARGVRRHPLPLPPGVAVLAIAGASSPRGDGLVPVDSALGRHADPRFDLRLPASHQRIAQGVGHLQLQTDDAVQRQVIDWLA